MRAKRFARDKRGATAVEFALTAPIFLMILCMIVVGGLLLWTQLGLQHGAEMAARCAGVNKTICASNAATQYDEVTAATTGLSFDPGWQLMSWFLAK